jgi:GTP cyclohydrolase I
MKLLQKSNGNIPRTEEEQEHMIQEAAKHYGMFLTSLGFEWQGDEQTKDTPRRVAKAWVHDLIKGSISNPPKISTFPNDENYNGIVVQTNIPIVSMCAHHNLAFTGHAHVGYIPGSVVIGLSKLNRIVEWFSRRPQMQESLTQQIHDFINNTMEGNSGVAVSIECRHTCCSHRGIKHPSTMVTNKMSGTFMDNSDLSREEFFDAIKLAQAERK